MSAPDEPRRWTAGHPDGPRIDTDGVAWFADDPYPTWYRHEGGKLITKTRPTFPPVSEIKRYPTDSGQAFMEIVPSSFVDYREKAMSSQGTSTWPPLTEKQEERLARWLEEVSPIFGATIYRHDLCWQYLDEARPGRGYDVQVVYLDSDSFVTMAMDPYGHGWDANGTVEVAHNSSDEECPCKGCEAGREAEL